MEPGPHLATTPDCFTLAIGVWVWRRQTVCCRGAVKWRRTRQPGPCAGAFVGSALKHWPLPGAFGCLIPLLIGIEGRHSSATASFHWFLILLISWQKRLPLALLGSLTTVSVPTSPHLLVGKEGGHSLCAMSLLDRRATGVQYCTTARLLKAKYSRYSSACR